ncbi:hypothetical protein L798_00113 [Zootermopsis nevadensis]|uniref:Uncharacterized protein n=1 Tax=Zootermopsis nevadensis TaxID=136037 RepID=A0A067RN28_ZOONE|nr:hypothetical protein L798_00113 [Zootermopsis nevadensis]
MLRASYLQQRGTSGTQLGIFVLLSEEDLLRSLTCYNWCLSLPVYT